MKYRIYFQMNGASDPAGKFIEGDLVNLKEYDIDCFVKGDTYAILKNEFHWARPSDEMGITLIKIVNKVKDEWARLVCPKNIEPVHAIKFAVDDDDRDLLQEVKERLLLET